MQDRERALDGYMVGCPLVLAGRNDAEVNGSVAAGLGYPVVAGIGDAVVIGVNPVERYRVVRRRVIAGFSLRIIPAVIGGNMDGDDIARLKVSDCVVAELLGGTRLVAVYAGVGVVVIVNEGELERVRSRAAIHQLGATGANQNVVAAASVEHIIARGDDPKGAAAIKHVIAV